MKGNSSVGTIKKKMIFGDLNFKWICSCLTTEHRSFLFQTEEQEIRQPFNHIVRLEPEGKVKVEKSLNHARSFFFFFVMEIMAMLPVIIGALGTIPEIFE